MLGLLGALLEPRALHLPRGRSLETVEADADGLGTERPIHFVQALPMPRLSDSGRNALRHDALRCACASL